MEDELFRWLLSKIDELEGSETDRFLKFFAILNTFLEEKGVGKIIIVGGFAAEIYSGRSYRTGDVDIIVEGDKDLVSHVLERISEKGLRILLPKIKEISEKGIDIVGTVYDKKKKPWKINVNSYHVYIIPPEELILIYLEAWKYWNSLEDRNKAVLVYCAMKEKIDEKYLEEEAKRKSLTDYLQKAKEYC